MSKAPIINIELDLRGPLAAKLELEAKRRASTPAELLSDVIEIVINDNLFKAVLE